MDMSAGYQNAITNCLPNATIVFDRFHVQQLASKAVDEVRREQWQQMRRKDPDEGRAIKKTRWALLKRPWNVTPKQNETLSAVARTNAPLYRAYLLKESLAGIYDRLLLPGWARRRIGEWLAWATKARLATLESRIFENSVVRPVVVEDTVPDVTQGGRVATIARWETPEIEQLVDVTIEKHRTTPTRGRRGACRSTQAYPCDETVEHATHGIFPVDRTALALRIGKRQRTLSTLVPPPPVSRMNGLSNHAYQSAAFLRCDHAHGLRAGCSAPCLSSHEDPAV